MKKFIVAEKEHKSKGRNKENEKEESCEAEQLF